MQTTGCCECGTAVEVQRLRPPHYCRPCFKEHRRKYQREYQREHAAKYYNGGKRQRAYKERHPDRMAAILARNYQAHKSERDAANRAWAKANPESRRAHARAYYEHNKSKVQQTNRSRRQRLVGSFTDSEIVALTQNQRGRCWYCGDGTKPLTVDHSIPVSRGGPNLATNLVMACLPCNVAKGRRLVEEWLF